MDKKAELLKCAKELFTTLGYKNTNISKITKMAGMATGTFYNYFESKDSIFMEIYIEENGKLKEEILKEVDLDANPMEVMHILSKLNYQGMMNNPILRHWYDKETFNKIEQSFKTSNGLDNLDFMYNDFIKIIEYWQENNKIRKDIKSDMIMAIFNALINVDLHKEEIGIKYFPDMMDYLSQFVMDGLMTTETK